MEDLPAEILVKDLAQYRSDWWALSLLRKRRGDPAPLPKAAVRPRTIEEVAAVLRWASGRRVPVVAWGGGSGVCGAAEPGPEAIVLDLTAMNAVIEVDPRSLMVSAQAGIFGPALEEAIAAHGMTLGHVPQSFHLSTLGGWIGTKAIGQLSTRYGGIEERVLGLTAVLSDGTAISSKRVPRASTGPDWWRAFIGAEGTLGVVCEATLSAFAAPETTRWMGAAVASFSEGLDLLRRLVQAGLRPAVARLYDQADASLSFGALGLGSTPLIILRFEGAAALVEAEVLLAEKIAAEAGAQPIGPEAGEHWWNHRFDAVAAYRRLLAGEGALGPLGVVDTMEVAAFWGGLEALYLRVRDALARHADVVLAHASHLYMSGANIYFTFLISSAADEEDAEARYRAVWKSGMEAALEAGGTISHHHGVGLLKSPWMADELGSGAAALRRLKEAFDPEGIMNPGKLGL